MAIELRSDKYPKKFQNSKFLSQQIQKKIEALGGEMANSVEKETTALVSDPGANTILFLSELLHWFAILNIPFSKMVCYPLFISWLVCTVQIEEVKYFFCVCVWRDAERGEKQSSGRQEEWSRCCRPGVPLWHQGRGRQCHAQTGSSPNNPSCYVDKSELCLCA